MKLNKLLKTILFLLVLGVCGIAGYKIGNYITNKILDDKNNFEEKLDIDGKKIKFKVVQIDENLKISIPNNFNVMPEEKIKLKYPSGNTPSLVYSNDEYNVNVAFSLSNSNMDNDQIPNYHEYINTMLENSGKILDENLYKRDEKNFGEIKFITKAYDTDIYNHMVYFSLDNKLIIVNFNCTILQRNSWEIVGNRIIESLVID